VVEEDVGNQIVTNRTWRSKSKKQGKKTWNCPRDGEKKFLLKKAKWGGGLQDSKGTRHNIIRGLVPNEDQKPRGGKSEIRGRVVGLHTDPAISTGDSQPNEWRDSGRWLIGKIVKDDNCQ